MPQQTDLVCYCNRGQPSLWALFWSVVTGNMLYNSVHIIAKKQRLQKNSSTAHRRLAFYFTTQLLWTTWNPQHDTTAYGMYGTVIYFIWDFFDIMLFYFSKLGFYLTTSWLHLKFNLVFCSVVHSKLGYCGPFSFIILPSSISKIIII